MTKAKPKEIRVTFTDKEEDLYNFIISKSSKTAFLKDLAAFEKERQERILNVGYVGYAPVKEQAIETQEVQPQKKKKVGALQKK